MSEMVVPSGRESDRQLDLTRRQWSGLTPGRHVWNHPLTGALVNRRIGGRPDVHWHNAIKAEFFADRKFNRVLSIGCGTGHFERSLFGCGYFESGVGVELSGDALKIAREQAALIKMPFDYIECNLNEGLPPHVIGPFDLVVAEASLHHIATLEQLLFQVNRRMTQDGHFMFSEYGGPARFQWTDEQLRLGNAIRDLLPKELKGEFGPLVRPTYTEFMNTDPSEAVGGRNILDVFRFFFKVEVERNTCAALTHPALNPLFQFFDDGNELHNAILKLVYLLDEILVDLGHLPSDKFVIGRPRMDV